MDISQLRAELACWITGPDLLRAALAYEKDPARATAPAEAAVCAFAGIRHGDDGGLRDLIEEGLRGLRPPPRAVAIAHWYYDSYAPGRISDATWRRVEEATFSGSIETLSTEQSLRRRDQRYPVIILRDSNVVLDLISGPATLLAATVAVALDVWRPMASELPKSLLLPSAPTPLSVHIEGHVMRALGFTDPAAAGEPVSAVNGRYGFMTIVGRFPEDFCRRDFLARAQEGARELAETTILDDIDVSQYLV